QLAVQRVRGPVGRHVASVAPDGAKLHPAHRLPHVLSRGDVLTGDDNSSVRGDDRCRNRWSLLVDAHADAEKNGERDKNDGSESKPSDFHFALPFGKRCAVRRRASLADFYWPTGFERRNTPSKMMGTRPVGSCPGRGTFSSLSAIARSGANPTRASSPTSCGSSRKHCGSPEKSVNTNVSPAMGLA